MKEWILSAIFVVHAAVFASLYFRRGRRSFDLLFVGGFVLLAAFYATGGWLSTVGIEPLPRHLSLLRWAGLLLCALATPPFLIHWYRRRSAAPIRPSSTS